ncbi:MAG: lipopolysaccharide biosynthesis protein [Clostridia bacterium]|nr:lipopolysaccharide biosynthesis protein [Clostridia bacterium]
MGKDNIGSQVASGALWMFAERIGAQLISFVVSTAIARFTAPEHYGTIALINVFITFANLFVVSGFGSALIQKKDAGSVDFSSVFYTNLVFSIAIYAVLFLSAPLIAKVYNSPEVVLIIRILGFRIILASVNTIQHAYVSKTMQFRKFFWSTIIGTLISGVVGFALAFYGYGVWALVAQYMTNTLIDTIVLFITTKWRPTLEFSWTRVKELVSYAWKLLVSELINTTYIEVRALVIGLKYSSADLAYYNRGQSLPKLVSDNINSAMQSVLFPAMSKKQDDIEAFKTMAKRSIQVAGYTIMPMVLGLGLVAEPLIRLLLTETWISCVPYLQLFCLFYCLKPAQSAGLQVIRASGRSDIYLKQEIIKKLVGFVAILASIPFGPLAICAVSVIVHIFETLLTSFATKRILGYPVIEQFKDIFIGFIPLFCMSAVVILIGFLPIGDFAMICLQASMGAMVYLGVSVVTKNDAFAYSLTVARGFLKK